MSLVTGWSLGGRGTDMENLKQALYNDFCLLDRNFDINAARVYNEEIMMWFL